jgi:hypothetical protein
MKKALASVKKAPVGSLLRIPVKHVSFLQKNYISRDGVAHVRLNGIWVKSDHRNERRPFTRKTFGGIETAPQAGVDQVQRTPPQ